MGRKDIHSKSNPIIPSKPYRNILQTMAPNTVTLIGFVLMALSYFCMLFFDDTFTKDLPRWTYIFAAVCQFLYQTLDAVDGKHARTTKASSPLGQLFDHGILYLSGLSLILQDVILSQ